MDHVMETPRKYNDCYFYYYSTCTKGDSCVFRHEPLALGCEIMCSLWQQGRCLDKNCKLRHMELRKNRKQIPCYWENKPGGCRKKHCPFMHKNPEARIDGIAPIQSGPSGQIQATSMAEAMQEPSQMLAQPPQLPQHLQHPQHPQHPQQPQHPQHATQLLWSQRQALVDSGTLGMLVPGEIVPRTMAPIPVDSPLVVNFDEESDNESTPTNSPESKVAKSKCRELLLLEKIQAEAAAYYSYDDTKPLVDIKKENRKIVRTNLSVKYDKLSLDEIAGTTNDVKPKAGLDFKILSLDEIRARKKVNTDVIVKTNQITLNLSSRKRKMSTHDTMASGSKVVKVVCKNNKSVVYKKVDDDKYVNNGRKRTFSEQSQVVEIKDDEVEECFKFKKIRLSEPTTSSVDNMDDVSSSTDVSDMKYLYKSDDSDNEVQIVDEVATNSSIIDVDDSIGSKDQTDTVIDLSEDTEDCGLVGTSNVPDVISSCVKINEGKRLLNDIDKFLQSES